MEFHRADYAAAQTYLKKSLSLFRNQGDREGVASVLGTLARVLARHGQEEKAVLLWGAAQSLRESIGVAVPRNEQKNLDEEVEQARLALGDEAFTAAWERGRAMTWEEATAYILG